MKDFEGRIEVIYEFPLPKKIVNENFENYNEIDSLAANECNKVYPLYFQWSNWKIALTNKDIRPCTSAIVFSISKGKDLVMILGWWRFFYQIFEVFNFFRGLLRKSFIHQKFWNDVNESLVKYQDNRRRFENVREKMKKTKFWRWK